MLTSASRKTTAAALAVLVAASCVGIASSQEVTTGKAATVVVNLATTATANKVDTTSTTATASTTKAATIAASTVTTTATKAASVATVAPAATIVPPATAAPAATTTKAASVTPNVATPAATIKVEATTTTAATTATASTAKAATIAASTVTTTATKAASVATVAPAATVVPAATAAPAATTTKAASVTPNVATPAATIKVDATTTTAATTATASTTKAATIAASTVTTTATKAASVATVVPAATAATTKPATVAVTMAATTTTRPVPAPALSSVGSDPSLAALAAEVARLASSVTQLKSSNDQLFKELQSAKSIAKSLARQVSTQQLFVEERIRSDGSSGIKRNRNGRAGTKAYQTESVIGGSSALSVHDHANYDRTPGLGELIAVLNGVEFRTRHNDYKLVMPSKLSHAYQAIENIPFPDVPPEVLAKKTVKEQVDEMREFFKAWKFQNPKLRDYTKYFKAALCYLEGSWTQSTAKIDEPFQSDRHLIDASSWFDLLDKTSFMSHTGKKHIDENLAFLPTTIADFANDTPIYAQYNYRILCHPVSFDVPFKALQVVDDVATRMKLGMPYPQLATSRAARFVIGPDIYWNGDPRGIGYNSLVDRMMREIPGLNNYPANITDDAQFLVSMEPGKPNVKVNAGYYHRVVSMGKDAMGLSTQTKGFNDANLYVALTTQPKVVAKSIHACYNSSTCKTFPQRLSYAIPLELIYLTPLQSWNPYKLAIHDRGTVATDNGKRNGKPSLAEAFNGTSRDNYYLTPDTFFNGEEIDSNPADTAVPSVTVLDPSKEMHNVTASGIRVLFPNIAGVGVLRQRYPVFPVHEEGSHAYQNVEALKEMLMDQNKYAHLYRNPPGTKLSITPNTNATMGVALITSVAIQPSRHEHTVTLDADDVAITNAGGIVQKFTSAASGHTHSLHIKSVRVNNSNVRTYVLVQCDGKEPPCWDGHETVRTGSN